jgi:hypothetical protein
MIHSSSLLVTRGRDGAMSSCLCRIHAVHLDDYIPTLKLPRAVRWTANHSVLDHNTAIHDPDLRRGLGGGLVRNLVRHPDSGSSCALKSFAPCPCILIIRA